MNLSKLFLTIISICLLTVLSADAITRRPVYSDDYAHRLELCGSYEEDYFYNINAPGTRLNLKTTESIIGIRGGKCATRSVIYLRTHPKPIGEIKCSLTEAQRKNLAAKIRLAKKSPREELYYKQTYANYTHNPEICTFIDYTEDD